MTALDHPRTDRPLGLAAVLLLLLGACAPALRGQPEPAAVPGAPGERSADDLLRAAEEAWSSREQPGRPAQAEALFLGAARADPRSTDGFIGAMRAMSYRLERETDPAVRAKLAEQQVVTGLWCQQRAPGDARCDYRLAIALGQKARERPATFHDALTVMANLLRKAIRTDPGLDSGGPHRVLAFLLLRAPGWPLGPGDPEAGLVEAEAAARLFPDEVENQLALGEALGKNGQPERAHDAYARALALAAASRAAGDPGAAQAMARAAAGMERYGAR
jgi:tetratricopeptide (TPR) repeat protein